MRLSAWVKATGDGAIAQLARRCGVAYSTAHDWCSHKRNPEGPNIAKIFEATDGAVTLADLVNNKRYRASMRKRKRRASASLTAAA